MDRYYQQEQWNHLLTIKQPNPTTDSYHSEHFQHSNSSPIATFSCCYTHSNGALVNETVHTSTNYATKNPLTFEFKGVMLSPQADQFQDYFGRNLYSTSDINMKSSAYGQVPCCLRSQKKKKACIFKISWVYHCSSPTQIASLLSSKNKHYWLLYKKYSASRPNV